MKRSGLPRLFVALYDYDPVTQSPNEDAADVSRFKGVKGIIFNEELT